MGCTKGTAAFLAVLEAGVESIQKAVVLEVKEKRALSVGFLLRRKKLG